jgi:type II secretory ATPase GspE/PulE/Tfp pilus assembly ATPase PilB-like protein
MQEHIRRALISLRPDAERAGVGIDLFFVDEDFAIVEVLLTGTRGGEFRERIETLLLREAPGLRQVDFIDEAPIDATTEKSPSSQTLARLAAGTDLALDIISQTADHLENDAQAARLRRPREVGPFLDGPYRAWLEEARHLQGEFANKNPEPQAGLGTLKDIFAAIDRTARALIRTVRAESGSWEDHEEPPRVLSPSAKAELSQAQHILEDLRPLLDGSTLAGFAAGEECSSGGDTAGPSVSLLDRIFKDAASHHVRDVYIEPGDAKAVLQYRRGRTIERVLEFPKTFYSAVLARLKHLASLNVADHAHKQEGLITFTAKSGYHGLKVQVQTIPNNGVERVHMRLRLPSLQESCP